MGNRYEFMELDNGPAYYRDKEHSSVEYILNHSNYCIFLLNGCDICFWSKATGEGLKMEGGEGFKHYFLNVMVQELADNHKDCREAEYSSGTTIHSTRKIRCKNCGESYEVG